MRSNFCIRATTTKMYPKDYHLHLCRLNIPYRMQCTHSLHFSKEYRYNLCIAVKVYCVYELMCLVVPQVCLFVWTNIGSSGCVWTGGKGVIFNLSIYVSIDSPYLYLYLPIHLSIIYTINLHIVSIYLIINLHKGLYWMQGEGGLMHLLWGNCGCIHFPPPLLPSLPHPSIMF